MHGIFWWILTINVPGKRILKKNQFKMSKSLFLPAPTPIRLENINKRIYLFTHPDSFSKLLFTLCSTLQFRTNTTHKSASQIKTVLPISWFCAVGVEEQRSKLLVIACYDVQAHWKKDESYVPECITSKFIIKVPSSRDQIILKMVAFVEDPCKAPML